jgi:hypothetical protein
VTTLSETNCFHSAVRALHIVHEQPVLILSRSPVEPTLAALERPGEVVVRISIPLGASWPDPTIGALAAGALGQNGAVAVTFADLGDALGCLRRIAADNQADAPGGAA